MTPGVQDLVVNRNVNLMKFLRRHLTGDWGDVSPGSKQANNAALRQKERVLSAYEVMPNVKIWFITEGDRQATTALLPSEY